MRTWVFYVTASLALVLLSVSHSASQSIMEEYNHRKDEFFTVNERFNFFDLELVKYLASTEQGNFLISPVSVKAALAMILEGAGGKSAAELREALRLTDNPEETRNQFKNYFNSLQMNTPETKVEAANQIFLSQSVTPRPRYETMLKTYYLSNIERVDFTKPSLAAQIINRWVNMLTHGLIPALVEPGTLSSNTKLMITNAMFFDGKWKYSFEFDNDTSIRCFFVDVNVCLHSYNMDSIAVYDYAYVSALKAHAIELPYEGNKFSMLILLPSEVNGIQQLVRDLTHVSLHNVVSSMQKVEILLTLPRFKINYDIDLLSKLEDLGIHEIFTPNSNLSGIVQTNADLHISNVLHKAVIEVNENGTVAASAIGTMIIPLMGQTSYQLMCNHPFLFFIRNTVSGDILFAGRLAQPDEVMPAGATSHNGTPPNQSSTQAKPSPPPGARTTSPPLVYKNRNDGAVLRMQHSADSHPLYAVRPFDMETIHVAPEHNNSNDENEDRYKDRIHFETDPVD